MAVADRSAPSRSARPKAVRRVSGKKPRAQIIHEERETKAAGPAYWRPIADCNRPIVLKRTERQRSGKPTFPLRFILRKEVIQPQVPLRLPCYDFTPVAEPTVVSCLLAVSALPSGKPNSHGVTGGVYKARERIHRGMLIRDY
jgi:hypothetical protein